MSGQVRERAPLRHFTALTLPHHSAGLLRAIDQADAGPIPMPSMYPPSCESHDTRGRPTRRVQPLGSLTERIR